ncbi:hypothetical protein PR003_g20829 [Phytophthora rubi]|uniref:Uncharacterized protein n=1 Tax=Phytophthora rubi TaxID=129364 RepID=A0A6A3JTK8_9STRA|nr:hypothetical protein PR001_g19798 [Phytophthora rubi]KAE9308085.1 hypothetical protein PR003_g20829 [Phytophthora rubi]
MSGEHPPVDSCSLRAQGFGSPKPTRQPRHPKASPITPGSKTQALKRIQVEEPTIETKQAKKKLRTPGDSVSARLRDECKLSAISGWSKADIRAKLQRAKSQRRERARRMLAALEAEKKRAREYHEVPGRFEIEKLVQIRRDVNLTMMREQLEEQGRAAGRNSRQPN